MPAIHLVTGGRPPETGQHKCPFCRIMLPRGKGVCSYHPALRGRLRDELDAAWDSGRGAGSERYLAAVAAAEAVLAERERRP